MKDLEPEYYNSALMKKLDVMLQDGLGPVIARLLRDELGDTWIEQFSAYVKQITGSELRLVDGKPGWDFNRVMHGVVLYGKKKQHRGAREERRLADELRRLRNSIAHAGHENISTSASIERTFEFLRKTERMLDAFGVVAQLREVRALIESYEKDLGAGMVSSPDPAIRHAPAADRTLGQPVSDEPDRSSATSGRDPATAPGKPRRKHWFTGIASALVLGLAVVADLVGVTQWLFGNGADRAAIEASEKAMAALAGLTAEVEAYVTDEARCANLGQAVNDIAASDSARLTAAAKQARAVATECDQRFAASDSRLTAVRQSAAELAAGDGNIDELAEATVRLTSFDLARHRDAETRQALDRGGEAIALLDASRTRLARLTAEWTRFSANQSASAQDLAQALGAITSGDEQRATPAQLTAIAAASAFFAQTQASAPVSYSAVDAAPVFADPDAASGANPIVETGIQNPTQDSFAVAPATQEAPNPIVVVK